MDPEQIKRLLELLQRIADALEVANEREEEVRRVWPTRNE
jgi:hypothetical protein